MALIPDGAETIYEAFGQISSPYSSADICARLNVSHKGILLASQTRGGYRMSSHPIRTDNVFVLTSFLGAGARPDLQLAICPKQSGIDLYRDTVAVKSISNSFLGPSHSGSKTLSPLLTLNEIDGSDRMRIYVSDALACHR